MRALGRSLLVALVIAALCNLPLAAAPEASRPVGTVILAEGAHLDNVDAAVGASVFPGDELATVPQGKLRLRLGTAQVYLLSETRADVDASPASMNLKSGTAGFASSGPEVVAVRLPGDVVVASKGPSPAYGQVTIVSPAEFLVTSFHGSLNVDVDGEVTTVAAPNSYRVMVEQDAEGAGTKDKQQAGQIPVHRKRRAVFYLIIGGAAALASYFIYRAVCESSYIPAPTTPQSK